jgi:hypothetical protein
VQALAALKSILIRSGFKNLIEDLDLDEFINKIEKDAVKGETSTH